MVSKNNMGYIGYDVIFKKTDIPSLLRKRVFYLFLYL